MTTSAFQKLILGWYRMNGRHDLSWRPPLLKLRKDHTLDPYRILVSEVMLQQTQVSRVIPKYQEFLKVFPTLRHLAGSSNGKVLRVWQGMGYNRRALYLKRSAETIVKEFGGRIPADRETLESLPGIGRNTAGAILAFAFGKRVSFIETNIRRVYLHCFFGHRASVPDSEVLRRIHAAIPLTNVREWYYALMDYGAGALKSMPNPNTRSKHYTRQSSFKGSRRELRGKIVRELIRKKQLRTRDLQRRLQPKTLQTDVMKEIIQEMSREGFLTIRRNVITLSH